MAASHLPCHCQASGCPLWELLECIAWLGPPLPLDPRYLILILSTPILSLCPSPCLPGFPTTGSRSVCVTPIEL